MASSTQSARSRDGEPRYRIVESPTVWVANEGVCFISEVLKKNSENTLGGRRRTSDAKGFSAIYAASGSCVQGLQGVQSALHRL